MRAALYLLVVVGMAACGHATQTGPAWPAPSTTAEDGGESLDPRSTNTVAAAIEESDEPEVQAEDPADGGAKADTAEPATDDASTSTPTSQPGSDEPIMTEEIIIEIED